MADFARHIHLDFHTSELLSVGDRFDSEDFIKTLTDAQVNSIVVFAKCHHGWCYYPTKIGRMHPQLKFDLMGEQIKACRKAGIRVVAYITGAWSASDIDRHPDWQAISFTTGKPMFTYHGKETNVGVGGPEEPKPDCHWGYLCMAGEYGEHMKALTREVLENYDVDGLFFDIMGLNNLCVCPHCAEKMKKESIDVTDEASVRAFTIRERQRLLGELRDIVKEKGENLTVFFNSGGAEIDQPEYIEYSTHYEMENLASKSSLGYDGISNRSKYFRETGKNVWGMTGKFHTTWGEFGGFKHPDALLQECAAMVAYGVRCDVGDQLHPDGKINKATYDLIGRAFSYVKSLENYIDCGQTVARLGVMVSKTKSSREGVAKLLMDAHMDYSILLPDLRNIDRFDCVILPATTRLTEEQEKALVALVRRGGRVVLFGMPEGSVSNLLHEIGYTDLGWSEYDKTFINYPGEGFPKSPILMDVSTHNFHLAGEILAKISEPFFSRTEAHYCSHRNTPDRREVTDLPAVAFNERALCFAYDFGTQYFEYGNYWCRAIFEDAIRHVYTPELTVKGLPVYGRYTFYQRAGERILHLLSLLPVRRGIISVLEEPIELSNIRICIPGKKPRRVLRMPEGDALDFVYETGELHFVLPTLRAHSMILIEDQ